MLQNFRLGVLLRLLSLFGCMALCFYLYLQTSKPYLVLALFVVLLGMLLAELFYYIDQTNRKLVRFLESIRYSDFTSTFNTDHRLGASFKHLNMAFNEVLEAFRKARAEKEEHWQYLHTVVQHINIGLISFDSTGKVHLLNNLARRFTECPQIINIQELQHKQAELYKIFQEIRPNAQLLFRKNHDLYLSVSAAELKLRERHYKIISLQNIQSELQQKETEAWQNLSKVLRHEIMNSITPIASLVATLQQILDEDLVWENGALRLSVEAMEDISEGLNTIANRGKGLIKFVDTYRSFTNIPTPVFEIVEVGKLFDQVTSLLKPTLESNHVVLSQEVEPNTLEIRIDCQLIEMVLINLIKNAMEAFTDQPVKQVSLKAYQQEQHLIIEVTDNGSGIIPEAIENIFIPFYTTKAEGSGIGLSWSRQIMQLHRGTLTVRSEVGKQTTFQLRF